MSFSAQGFAQQGFSEQGQAQQGFQPSEGASPGNTFLRDFFGAQVRDSFGKNVQAPILP